ncbi:MAG: rane protein [Xanthomonadaceae bacterium]|nr:rane protein [Xanthomonadaceae bacterium]
MPTTTQAPAPQRNWLAACGALYCAAAVGLAAYAAHAAIAAGQSRLELAAVFAFGHGVALTALSSSISRGPGRWALSLMAAGVLLFSGSLSGSVLVHWPTTLAPLGGMAMIAGWLVVAFTSLRT